MVLGIPKRTLVILAVLVGVVVIYALGSDRQSSGEEGAEGTEGQGSSVCRVSVDADVLNVRSGPGTGSAVVGKLRQDAESDATTVVENGFRKLAEGRWASDDFLQPADGADC